jgi:uncharacterized membrane protein YphA (DoxX/SURF4 family)
MNLVRLVSRIILGLAFIFSGTVKAIDPLGSTYKFQDYFQAFHLGFLQDFSLPLAILLCTAEFIAGFSVLTGIRQKTGIWVIMILMAIFTPLTLILALTNPVSDCGCFGDAIHLTNWQTFGKNIILLIPAVILFISRNSLETSKRVISEWLIISLFIICFITFNFYNLKYLPVLDFLPYKTGTYIPEKMVIPDNVSSDEYMTTFIYEKNGVEKEFTVENYPAEDTTWKFVDQKSVLIKKGYEPPIHDFSITTLNDENLTQEVLNNPGYTFFMISKKLEEADKEKLLKGFELGYNCMKNQIDFYILTASSSDELSSFANELQFCLMDETTLKTIVRANPGYVLLKNGTIMGKWSWANVPEKEWFTNLPF